jgi:hypothetical protein
LSPSCIVVGEERNYCFWQMKRRAMISNEFHLKLAKAELAKWLEMLAELEAAQADSRCSLSARAATIRQEIREQELEIRQYEEAKQRDAMTPLRS